MTPTARVLFPAAVFSVLLAMAGESMAVTVVLQQGNLPTSAYAGTIDTFVNNGPGNSRVGNNYGAAGALAVAADTTVNAANTQGQFLSLLQFDTSAAKSAFDAQYGVGNWVVTGVQLLLTAQAPNNSLFNGNGTLTNTAGSIDVSWLANNGWVEGSGTPALPSSTGLTYSNLGTYTGSSDEGLGSFYFNGGTSGTTTASLNLTTNFTADLLAGGLSTFELAPSAGSLVSAVFLSRNYTGGGYPSDRPELSITAVAAAPEPGRGALLLLAVGYFGVRRRRTRAIA